MAARPNSPNARQPLAHSKKLKGSKVNGHIAALGLSSVQMLLHTGHSMGPLGTIPNCQNRQGLPSDTASNSYESLLVHRPITVTGSKTIAPKSSSHDTPKEGPDHRSISTSVAF